MTVTETLAPDRPTALAADPAAILLEAAGDLSVPAGTLLFAAGDPADRVFLLRAGRVRLFVGDAGGGEAVLHVFGPGSLFGLPAMIGLQRFPVSAETLEPCRLGVMGRDALLERLARDPARLPELLGVMGWRWRRMAHRLAGLKALSPTRRVCGWLLAAAAEAGAGEGAGQAREAAFRLAVPHHVIAGAVGLAPETLSRTFARLAAEGIHVRRRDVRIDDMAALRRLAGATPHDAGAGATGPDGCGAGAGAESR